MVWYSHLFQNFPQFILIHTVKGFGIINKGEVYVFLELSCFFHDPADVGNLISGSSAFSKTSLNIWKFTSLKIFSCPFFFSSSSGTPIIQMLVHLIWSQRSLRLSSVLSILLTLFCSSEVISTILSSSSLICSSASDILLLIPSRAF